MGADGRSLSLKTPPGEHASGGHSQDVSICVSCSECNDNCYSRFSPLNWPLVLELPSIGGGGTLVPTVWIVLPHLCRTIFCHNITDLLEAVDNRGHK